MKKFAILLLSFLVLFSAIPCYADTESKDILIKEEDIKRYSQKLNIDDSIISTMTYDQVEYLLSCNARANVKSVKSYNVVLENIDNENAFFNSSAVLNLNESEYQSLIANKSKKILRQELDSIDKVKKFSSQLTDKSINEVKSINLSLDSYGTMFSTMSSSDNHSEDSFDFGVIETQIVHLDTSTSYEKKIYAIFSFDWIDSPLWTLEDGLGISHSGTSFGYTHIYQSGGTYECWVDLHGVTITTPLSPSENFQGLGIEEIFDLKSSSSTNRGSIYVEFGNPRSAITNKDSFYIFGQYGHKTMSGSVSVSLSSTGVTFSPTLVGKVKETTQVEQPVSY